MRVPSYITIYDGNKKLKPGAECPKHLEKPVQKAIDTAKARAKKLGERLAPYDNEEQVIRHCSPYPEYVAEVARIYGEARKAKPDGKKKEEEEKGKGK
jgi:hypothetical protein